jgi:methyltransferase (TIGR00027 family)
MRPLTPLSSTAVAVAYTRAVESARPDRLFDDPYAAGLVAAAGTDLTAARILTAPDAPHGDYFALRTRFLDDVCRRAGRRQVVLLAAGVDTRAQRLPWPAGTRLYELDTPAVLDFKAEALVRLGARDRCERVAVAGDLLEDWPAALAGAGFRPERPTLWVVEGLLLYLPAAGRTRLLERLHALSAPGSRAAVEDIGGGGLTVPVYLAWADRHGLPYPALASTDAWRPATDDLAAAGWDVRGSTLAAVAVEHGRPVPPLWDPAIPGSAAAHGVGGLLLDARLGAG